MTFVICVFFSWSLNKNLVGHIGYFVFFQRHNSSTTLIRFIKIVVKIAARCLARWLALWWFMDLMLRWYVSPVFVYYLIWYLCSVLFRLSPSHKFFFHHSPFHGDNHQFMAVWRRWPGASLKLVPAAASRCRCRRQPATDQLGAPR